MSSEPKEARRYARERVSWPVVVDDGQRFHHAETLNVSPAGAKIRLGERLPLGAEVGLTVRPPDRSAFEVRAIVWRVDPDGPALVFLGVHPREQVAAGEPRAARADVKDPGRRERATETILLVDDDPGVRALARDVLETEGYTVLDADGDPIKAVLLAKEHPGPIHLLLSDIVMPLMNGLHLVERVTPLRPTMKVLLMSAYPVSGVSSRGAGFLAKPFSIAALAAKVRDVLDGRSPFARPPAPPREG